jgi:hypothetical protein
MSMEKEMNSKLDLIVDQVRKRSETRLSSTLARLRGKLREEQAELLNQLPPQRPAQPNLGL